MEFAERQEKQVSLQILACASGNIIQSTPLYNSGKKIGSLCHIDFYRAGRLDGNHKAVTFILMDDSIRGNISDWSTFVQQCDELCTVRMSRYSKLLAFLKRPVSLNSLLKQGIVIQSVITFRISENLIYLNRNIIT
jgi:hypothetical protein